MESPLKKKKLHHHNDEENIQIMNEQDDENVKIILSDSLYESKLFSNLQNQFGGRKFKEIQSEHTYIDHIRFTHDVKCIRTCPKKKNLLLLHYSKELSIYDLESKQEIRNIHFKTSEDFEIDDQGDFIYYITKEDYLTKSSLLDERSKLNTIWEEKINYQTFIFCESKNEIYVIDHFNTEFVMIHVLDVSNGELIREIVFPIMNLITECDGGHLTHEINQFYYDENGGRFYLAFESVLVDDEDSDDKTIHSLYVFEEKIGKTSKIHINYLISMIGILQENYFFCLDECRNVHIYSKNTNELKNSFTMNSTAQCIYFDMSTNRLFHKTTRCIEIFQLNIITKNESFPINREMCQAIKRLGGEFPQYLSQHHQVPNTVNFLRNINFRNTILKFVDNEIKEHFSLKELLCNSNIDNVPWGYLKQQKCWLFVIFEEVSNINDFPIYLCSSKDRQILSRTYTFSEFLSKCTPVEQVSVLEQEYLIDFHSIYQNLLQKGIIHPQTRKIDPNILLAKYREMVCKNIHIIELRNHFQYSTIKLENTEYTKMDLIVAAERIYSDATIPQSFIIE
ncbi:predicted protein [Naegleria gruberi]|uniref:Predicted protein n=1 Tax=Naegleria gruberi TaxID=5762 RepID=D2VSC3_NAEGR|nr:uncharacterized protein NAEGRDRAFT_71889 [Naegleria gruberi]EFC40319.1 predicted protein [Naegleria gruberi]|eukprot:XP_002673063.1 predicted protein [Naegleria gruberi strain NEG-M]